jgi:hypothetical protein
MKDEAPTPRMAAAAMILRSLMVVSFDLKVQALEKILVVVVREKVKWS